MTDTASSASDIPTTKKRTVTEMSSSTSTTTATNDAASGGVVVESDHDKKYDRQMRLWGAHGQKKLQTASICVLHSGATSAEALKNLVLPNVGAFTIVDDAIVQRSDLGNNFFCDEAHLGQSRAETVTTLLREMNPDVSGTAVVKAVADVVRDDIEFFAPFRLVIATQMPRDAMLTLAAFCYARAIPLIVLQAYGLVARMRVCVPEHLVTESHPMSSRVDLYMHADQLAHFPALQAYIDSFSPDTMTRAEAMQHAHVPFPVLLVKAMARWRAAHDGAAPKSYAEKTAFKETLKAESREWRTKVGLGASSASEANYDEAVQHAFRCVTPPETDALTQAVLDDARALPQHQNADTAPFWILVRALNAFMAAEGHGFLPVSQDIPDMTSETDNYVRLKRVYKQKSDEDRDAVAAHVATALKSLGLPATTVTDGDITYFCKHVRDLRCIRMRSIAQEYAADTFAADAVNELFEEWREEKPVDEDAPVMHDPRMMHWYVALRAAEQFQSVHGRWPGVAADGRHIDGEAAAFDADKKTLVALAQEFTTTNKINTSVFEQCCEELVRYRACEMHNIAAYIGAVGAQAALKLLLQQYVPVNNTYLYNGIHCKSVTVTL